MKRHLTILLLILFFLMFVLLNLAKAHQNIQILNNKRKLNFGKDDALNHTPLSTISHSIASHDVGEN